MSASVDLTRHPATPCNAVRRIDVEIARPAFHVLFLTYRIEGDLARLRLPQPAAAQRVDGLWQHSCLEAFLRADGCDAYFEFNFSPSGAWAAYRFHGRRAGQTLPELTPPRAAVRRAPTAFALDIELSLDGLAGLADAWVLSAGLAAVIEDQNGGLSYWALAHGAECPDFHDPATFTLRVPDA